MIPAPAVELVHVRAAYRRRNRRTASVTVSPRRSAATFAADHSSSGTRIDRGGIGPLRMAFLSKRRDERGDVVDGTKRDAFATHGHVRSLVFGPCHRPVNKVHGSSHQFDVVIATSVTTVREPDDRVRAAVVLNGPLDPVTFPCGEHRATSDDRGDRRRRVRLAMSTDPTCFLRDAVSSHATNLALVNTSVNTGGDSR